MKRINSALAILCCAVSLASAFEPYVFERTRREYSSGGYAVIDSTKNAVMYSGNIIRELLADPTFYAEHSVLDNNDTIGDYYVDRKFKRLFMWTGLQDAHYDGALVLAIEDRRFVAYLQDGGVWGQASASIDVSHENVIYEMSWGDFGGPSDPEENAKEAEGVGVFNGENYQKVKLAQVPKFGISKLSSCFLPGENTLYDHLSGGLFDVSANRLVRPKSDFLKKSNYLDCAAGVLLLAQDKKTVASGGGRAIYLYDIQRDTVTQTVYPKNVKGWSPDVWKLSPDGRHAVWGRKLDGGGHHVDAVLSGGLAVIFDAKTGKQVYSLNLQELSGDKTPQRYIFSGFSVDGNKLLFHDGKTIYVFDMRVMKLTNRVPVPFFPDFIVWP